jgi:hypothetical protein
MIKNIRGGKREGAGRKALGKDKRISRSITIKRELLDEVENKFNEKKLSYVIEDALIEYIKKNKKE